MRMLVRRAVKGDFTRIRALDVLCDGIRIADGEHTWREWIEHCCVWVAEEGRRLVGAAVFFPTMGEARSTSISSSSIPASATGG